MRAEKILNQLPIAESTFFIILCHFLLVKAAVNAPRICVLLGLTMAHWC
jgi:hypothetical protein